MRPVPVKSATALAALCLSLAFSGCGAGPANSSSGTGSAAAVHAAINLAGNWDLVGPLPQGFSQPLNAAGATLSVTFSVTDRTVTGSGSVSVFCPTGNFVSGFGRAFLVSGTVAEDGSFSLATAPPRTEAGALPISIRGSVPPAPGAAWTGQYTVDASNAGSCNPVLSGTFQAAGIASVTGTYTGAGMLQQDTGLLGSGQPGTPVTLSVALAQSSSPEDESAMTGTLSITGVPCLHTGILMPPPATLMPRAGPLAGDEVVGTFRMDDGSQLALLGYLSDTSASALKLEVLSEPGGICGSSHQSLNIPSLVRGG